MAPVAPPVPTPMQYSITKGRTSSTTSIIPTANPLGLTKSLYLQLPPALHAPLQKRRALLVVIFEEQLPCCPSLFSFVFQEDPLPPLLD